jgi:hypothetical protein
MSALKYCIGLYKIISDLLGQTYVLKAWRDYAINIIIPKAAKWIQSK